MRYGVLEMSTFVWIYISSPVALVAHVPCRLLNLDHNHASVALPRFALGLSATCGPGASSIPRVVPHFDRVQYGGK